MLCTNCFDAEFVTVKKPYKIKINGVERELNDIEREECPECGESIFTQSQAIALDRRRVELEFGSKPLLTPYQLKLLRKILNLTLEQISEMLHIGKNSYGRWERGESDITPSMSLLIHNLIDRMPSAKVNLIETEMTKRILDAKQQILKTDKNISFGKYIKDCLEYTGIFTLIVCDRIDMREECLRNIENNKIDITTISPELVYKIASFFKATYEELVDMLYKSVELFRLDGEVSYIHARVDDNTASFSVAEENSLADILEAINAAHPVESTDIVIDKDFLNKVKQFYEAESQGV